MHERKPDHPLHEDRNNETQNIPGIISELGELQPGAIVTEDGVARLFKRHITSVKRAVQRGELPPPCRLFGTQVWTAGTLVRHLESRLAQAASDARQTTARIANLTPRLRDNDRIE